MLQLDIVTPESLLLSALVEQVIVPGTEGVLGILPKHSPLISALKPGVVTVYQAAKEPERFFVAGGVAEVVFEGGKSRCTILAEEALSLSSISLEQAKTRLSKAKNTLAEAEDSLQQKSAQEEINIAKALLKALEA